MNSGGKGQVFNFMVKEYSFSKAERLLNPKDFSRVIKNGIRFSTRNYTVYVQENPLDRHRLGLAVSARVTNGPGRVRLKRLLREFFRLNKKRLLCISSDSSNDNCYTPANKKRVDIVISVKRAAGTEQGPKRLIDVEVELLQLFDKKINNRFS